jgi:hypothetical protein
MITKKLEQIKGQVVHDGEGEIRLGWGGGGVWGAGGGEKFRVREGGEEFRVGVQGWVISHRPVIRP